MSARGDGGGAVRDVLARHDPGRVVYAPNYWQWYTHHRNHGRLPPEIAGCETQLDLIRWLGLDLFSRNIYCDPFERWFGGLAEEVYAPGVEVETRRGTDGRDRLLERVVRGPSGARSERLRYRFDDSTLVQETHLADGTGAGLDALGDLVAARRWRFDAGRYARVRDAAGPEGVVVAGELHGPLKMLHMAAGAADAVFLLEDHPERCAELMTLHEEAQLDLVDQMLDAGVEAMMAMDNLDSMFHPPRYIERCSARFYERAARRCHERGAVFFIHACGRQRALLSLVAGLGVDGLEGVAFPPLGDVELDEAARLAGDRMIVTGGISAFETGNLKTRHDVRRHVERLLARMRPHRHRFMLSASCNTSIGAPWETIVWFRDAWREFACA